MTSNLPPMEPAPNATPLTWGNRLRLTHKTTGEVVDVPPVVGRQKDPDGTLHVFGPVQESQQPSGPGLSVETAALEGGSIAYAPSEWEIEEIHPE